MVEGSDWGKCKSVLHRERREYSSEDVEHKELIKHV